MASGQYSDAAYRRAARAEYHREGEVEIDDNAVISRGDDAGAYVQAWVWVSDEEVRLDKPKKRR